MKESPEIILEKDFSTDPIEIFDGLEPNELWLDLNKFDIAGGKKINLIAEIANKYSELNREIYRQYYNVINCRVLAYNKSVHMFESRIGYLALFHSMNGKIWIILFSFFEVSAARYHCYLHRIYRTT